MPVTDESATFSGGDLVSGRYRIVRFVARGGMGEVYEAKDLELETTVALKTLLPEIGRSEVLIGRFKREIQLARQVTHPNVCRVFDLGHCQHPPHGDAARVTESVSIIPHQRLRADPSGKQNRATMSGINGMYSRVVLQYRKGPARPG